MSEGGVGPREQQPREILARALAEAAWSAPAPLAAATAPGVPRRAPDVGPPRAQRRASASHEIGFLAHWRCPGGYVCAEECGPKKRRRGRVPFARSRRRARGRRRHQRRDGSAADGGADGRVELGVRHLHPLGGGGGGEVGGRRSAGRRRRRARPRDGRLQGESGRRRGRALEEGRLAAELRREEEGVFAEIGARTLARRGRRRSRGRVSTIRRRHGQSTTTARRARATAAPPAGRGGTERAAAAAADAAFASLIVRITDSLWTWAQRFDVRRAFLVEEAELSLEDVERRVFRRRRRCWRDADDGVGGRARCRGSAPERGWGKGGRREAEGWGGGRRGRCGGRGRRRAPAVLSRVGAVGARPRRPSRGRA